MMSEPKPLRFFPKLFTMVWGPKGEVLPSEESFSCDHQWIYTPTGPKSIVPVHRYCDSCGHPQRLRWIHDRRQI